MVGRREGRALMLDRMARKRRGGGESECWVDDLPLGL